MSNPQQIFNTVSFKAPKRSLQNLSNTYKSVTDFGQIVPIGLYEVGPGDVMKKNSQIFMRAMPMLAPILHECDIYVHDFFVPWRLIWDDYEKFLIPQDDETAETIPLKPYINPYGTNTNTKNAIFAAFKEGSLGDYFGLPIFDSVSSIPSSAGEDTRLCSLPFRAYQLIWNEYYRDQNLQEKFEFSKSSGAEPIGSNLTNFTGLTTLRYRAWEKDYFTSALPRPQKGEPIGVELGSSSGGVVTLADDLSAHTPRYFYNTDTPSYPAAGAAATARGSYGNLQFGDISYPAYFDPQGSLVVENDSRGYFTIEMLRESMRLQEFMEQLMRGGSRYAEVVRNFFGQIPDDLRIGRPAYLGGGKQNLVISEVLQTSETTPDVSALGDMAGHGLSVGSSNNWRALFKEHGYVMSLLSVRPRSAYMQGVDKLWLKNDRYEQMWPQFAHLGEQPVMNGEIYWSWTDGKNRETFGYQPIYTEYRTKPSLCTGALRNSLDFWHLNRKFAARPSLNASFITVQPSETNRVFAVTEASQGQHLIFEAQNNVKMIRCIPRDGNPTL